jgi:MFS transporter, DHA1 family, tetracycline resistance protein
VTPFLRKAANLILCLTILGRFRGRDNLCMANVNKPLIVIFTAIALDSIGIGLIFPILPRLLEDVTHTHHVAAYVGIVTSLYAAMQFLFAPMLGALSDNFGRRPVLMLSLAGAAVNYLALAFAPTIGLLLLGRAIAGLTSANISVATAYVTDITPEEQRARRFGFFNAMFGLGFIIGPVIGGFLGDYSVRLPFIVAAVLNGFNFLLAFLMLPESRTPNRSHTALSALNPFRPLKWLFTMRALFPIVTVFFIFTATGEAYGTCWALWGYDVFRWNGFWIGLSLGAFAIVHTLVQAFLTGPAVKWFGERKAVIYGVLSMCVASVVMAFAKQGWVVFAAMPLFGLGDIGTPAFQALATRKVDESRQGQLQGVITSAMSMASIVAPLAFSTLYFAVQKQWPGSVWLAAVAVYLLAIPLVIISTRETPTA